MSYLVVSVQVTKPFFAALVVALGIGVPAAADNSRPVQAETQQAFWHSVACEGAAGASTDAGFPDASNTGVPEGTQLTAYTGPMTIETPGTVIDGKIITGTLRVTAPDVVIKNCVVNYKEMWGINAEYARNVIVQNCEITGPGSSGDSNAPILGSGTFIGNDLSQAENGIVLTDGASTVKGNYIHDLASGAVDPHYDGISVQGRQDGVLIEGNTIDSRGTSNIIIKTDFGDISNVTVTDNLLIGDAGFNVYSYGGENGYKTSNINITNNHIEMGNYDYYYIRDSNPNISGNIEYANNQAPQPSDLTPGNPSPSACAGAVIQR
jgi:hypothetical protein